MAIFPKDKLVHATAVLASGEAAKLLVYVWPEERVPIPHAVELQAREAVVRLQQHVDQGEQRADGPYCIGHELNNQSSKSLIDSGVRVAFHHAKERRLLSDAYCNQPC
jgi:hypothetical protein